MRTSDKAQSTLRFDDPDLRTPKHDQIVQWLSTEWINTVRFDPNRLTKHFAESLRWNHGHQGSRTCDACEAVIRDFKPAARVEKIECTWELPITKSNGWIVGYFDLYVKFNLLVSSYDHERGYVDDKDSVSFGIEAKSKIESLGELFRQLNTYRTVFEQSDRQLIAVASPDDRFKQVIEGQGFQFIKAP